MRNSHTRNRFSPGTMIAIAVFAATAMQVANAEDDRKFQALLHETTVHGAEDVQEGRYDVGIERLSRRVENVRAPHTTRVPALIDLCVAYTMTGQFEKAAETCNEAVESGWYSGYAYNNRGTYNIAVGDYEAAIRDFQSAIDGRGADDIARANLEFAQERLVARQKAADEVTFVARNVEDIEPVPAE